ncbi:MAG: hypothetical protein MJ196_03650 [Treponemataceae bacterium]|nr:hypothetical protein [Treponemataceae bacterium]
MKVIISDASAVIRVILEQKFAAAGDIQVAASVSNGAKAVDKIRTEKPDLLIIDDGKTDIELVESIIRDYAVPVLIFGDNEKPLFSFENASAITFVKKPKISDMNNDFFKTFIEQVRKAGTKVIISSFAKLNQSFDADIKQGTFSLLCIGASTGGPSAVRTVLEGLGKNFPLPVLYTQHVEVGDDVNMAKWFSETLTNIKFSLARPGEEALPGHVYMAPANKHLVIDFVNSRGTPVLALSDDPPVRFLKPSVDKTFLSAASFFKDHCLAVLLTGMGADGAAGCKALVDAGAYTIAEDESTCAVFGMPAAAIEMGGASIVLRREHIAEKVLSMIGR